MAGVALGALEARTAFLADLLAHGVCLPIFGTHLMHNHQSKSAAKVCHHDGVCNAAPSCHAVLCCAV
jgi:hypothetical protein